MEALTFLEKAGKAKCQPVYVVHGSEDFLKRQVLTALLPNLIGAGDPEFAVTTYPGDKAEYADVRTELDTLPFLSDRRVIVVDQADSFVTRNRAALEKYVGAPYASGVLILDVKTWTATTRLAKAVPEAATIDCKPPKPFKLPGWCVEWAKAQYGKKLARSAADLLMELVGLHMGVLDQELHKLASAVGERGSIELKDVDELVGRSREANVFKIIDAAGENKPAAALTILHELLEEGEAPIAILGAMGSQLRQLARTSRLYQQGVGIEDAMTEAGVPGWPEKRESVRRQLKQFGTQRLERLYDWLLEVDQGLKGGSALSDQLQLERLVVRLAGARQTTMKK